MATVLLKLESAPVTSIGSVVNATSESSAASSPSTITNCGLMVRSATSYPGAGEPVIVASTATLLPRAEMRTVASTAAGSIVTP